MPGSESSTGDSTRALTRSPHSQRPSLLNHHACHPSASDTHFHVTGTADGRGTPGKEATKRGVQWVRGRSPRDFPSPTPISPFPLGPAPGSRPGKQTLPKRIQVMATPFPCLWTQSRERLGTALKIISAGTVHSLLSWKIRLLQNHLPGPKALFFLQTLGQPGGLPTKPVPAAAVTSWHLAWAVYMDLGGILSIHPGF